MNRPVEDLVIGIVMRDWRLEQALAKMSGASYLYTLLLAAGWSRKDIISHRGVSKQSVDEVVRKIKSNFNG